MNSSVFTFLRNLSLNNTKEWFNVHKVDYEIAKTEVTSFFERIYNGIAQQDTVSPLKIHRIYRDLRFSKDKTPYKTHFGCYIQRKQPHYRGGYYVCISPQETFIGGGFFDPNKEDLLRMRQEISLNADDFKEVMTDKRIVETFGGQLWGDELKTAPKGFEKDDPMLNYLRKKQFLLKHDYTEKEALANNFEEKVVEGLLSMRPFFDFMTQALTTNLNGETLIH